MKYTCPDCGHVFAEPIYFDSLGWHTVCPACEGSFNVDPDPNGRGEKFRSAKKKADDSPAQSSYNAAYLQGYADALREEFKMKYCCISCGDPDATAWQWLTPEEVEAHRKAGFNVHQ